MKHIILASVFAFGAAAFAQDAQEPKQEAAPIAKEAVKKDEVRKDVKGHKPGKKHGAEKKEGM